MSPRILAVYWGIFWAALALAVAWIVSSQVAPEHSDLLHIAVAVPPSAYFILYFVEMFRRRKSGPGAGL